MFVNTAALTAVWSWTLRGVAVAVFAAVLIAVARVARFTVSPTEREVPAATPHRTPFGWAYWCVVGVEVVALFVGSRLLSGPLHASNGAVAWVSLVVGTHFFALAVIFAQPFFHWLGAGITACGAIGVVLAITGVGTDIIGLIAGVIPGALLLGFGWWGALRTQPVERVASPHSEHGEP